MSLYESERELRLARMRTGMSVDDAVRYVTSIRDGIERQRSNYAKSHSMRQSERAMSMADCDWRIAALDKILARAN